MFLFQKPHTHTHTHIWNINLGNFNLNTTTLWRILSRAKTGTPQTWEPVIFIIRFIGSQAWIRRLPQTLCVSSSQMDVALTMVARCATYRPGSVSAPRFGPVRPSRFMSASVSGTFCVFKARNKLWVWKMKPVRKWQKRKFLDWPLEARSKSQLISTDSHNKSFKFYSRNQHIYIWVQKYFGHLDRNIISLLRLLPCGLISSRRWNGWMGLCVSHALSGNSLHNC